MVSLWHVEVCGRSGLNRRMGHRESAAASMVGGGCGLGWGGTVGGGLVFFMGLRGGMGEGDWCYLWGCFPLQFGFMRFSWKGPCSFRQPQREPCTLYFY